MQTEMIKAQILAFCFYFLFTATSLAAGPSSWPPQVGQEFPDIALVDQDGETMHVSDFKGKILLIEFTGMNCPACQAFAGGNTGVGPFQNNAVQQGLQSISEYCPLYAKGFKLSDPRITYINILLYDMQMEAPQPRDAKEWAEHFHFSKDKNQHVLVPVIDMRNNASYNLIPGFQLVDKNFVVRSDSTGHRPRNNLWNELLPMIPTLIEE